VSIAKKYGAQVVIAIDLSEKLSTAGPRHLFGVTKRSLEIAYRKFVEQSLSAADIAISMNFDEVGSFVDHMNHTFYEHGRKVVQKQIGEIQTKLGTLVQKTKQPEGNLVPAAQLNAIPR
jgi:NTE family protein